MRSSKIKGRILAIFLTAALLVGSVSAITLSSGYTAPTEAQLTEFSTTTNYSNILTSATAAANTPVLSILGINVVSTDAAGVYNSAGYNGRTTPINLQIFGSEWNSVPDIYLATFYYNLGKVDDSDAGGNTYSASDYANWTGFYTLINSAKSGPTGAANNTTTIDIDVSGTTVNCNPVFYYEPDVLLGSTTSSYDTGLAYYQSTVNSSYSPLVLGGWSTSKDTTSDETAKVTGYCMNDGTFASTESMANGVYTIATSIEGTYGSTKTGRYGSVADCGATYANFAMGIYYYAQYAFANKILSPVIYCTNLTVNGSDSYTVATGSSRVAQYADGLGEEAEAGTYTLSQLAAAVNVVLSSSLSESEISTLESAGITVLDNTLPSTVYGTSMQAPDNILGTAYYFALMYSDQLAALKDEDGNSIGISLTPADVTAYFVENIYHVSSDHVDDAVELMMGTTGTTISSDYNSVINAMITAGADYYNAGNTNGYTWDSVDTVATLYAES